jgi:hypothetical protein
MDESIARGEREERRNNKAIEKNDQEKEKI